MLNQRTKDLESRGTTIKGHVCFEMLNRPSSSSLSSCFSGVCMYGGDLHTHNQCGPKCVNQFADPTFAHLSLSLSLSFAVFWNLILTSTQWRELLFFLELPWAVARVKVRLSSCFCRFILFLLNFFLWKLVVMAGLNTALEEWVH